MTTIDTLRGRGLPAAVPIDENGVAINPAAPVLAAGSAVIGKVGLQVGGVDVAATNPVPVGNGQVSTTTATISSGNSLSSGIDLGTARLARIVMPASWTAANLTFQTSPDNSTWSDLYDSYGTEYTVTAAASRAIIIPLVDFIGVRYIKVRSGTAGAAVAQGADRTLTLVLVP